MAIRLIDFNHTGTKEDLPEIKPGHVVKVHQKITETKVTGKKQETKERIQIFEGLVIGVKGGNNITATITVRKISGNIGVERIFPLNSPSIAKIEISKITKARRAKLNYMRDRIGKATKPKGELATEEDNKPKVKKGIEAKVEEVKEVLIEETPVEVVVEETVATAEEVKTEEVKAEETVAKAPEEKK
ncbi:MAG: 50S ribosomal protein L19 [Candidatus Paceibacterota bacterium]|jgi:large subunit ribosomal protein L19